MPDTAPGSPSRYLLSKFTPKLVEFVRLSNKDWRNLDSKMGRRISTAQKRLEEGENVWAAETTVLDLAYLAERDVVFGTRDAIVEHDFLRFIDGLVSELLGLIPEVLHPTARRQLRDLVVNFGLTQSKYRDKVGELVATVHLLRVTDARLLDFECRLVAGETSLDVLLGMPSGSAIPVEYLNVHVKDDRLEAEDDIDVFLDYRIAQKVKAKMGAVVPERGVLPFPLLLVLWFEDVQTLQRYAGRLAGRATGAELPACVIMQLRDAEDRVSWEFGSVQAFITRGLLPA
ncbi:MAG: hypothetical protein KC503_10345 [Myxococcales bacterium]|nr:hypothetical protein [Myxococcales bacterium]